MKRIRFFKFFIALFVALLALPMPAYAFSSCSLHPVLGFLVLLINLTIIFLIFYYPFKLIGRIRSEKNYPDFFKINKVLISLLFFSQFVIPAVLIFIISSLIPDSYYEVGNLVSILVVLLPVLLISIFAIWVRRRYGLKWGAKMLFVAIGTPLIYVVLYISYDYGSGHHEGLYGAIQDQTDKIFPPQCSSGLPVLPTVN